MPQLQALDSQINMLLAALPPTISESPTTNKQPPETKNIYVQLLQKTASLGERLWKQAKRQYLIIKSPKQ